MNEIDTNESPKINISYTGDRARCTAEFKAEGGDIRLRIINRKDLRTLLSAA